MQVDGGGNVGHLVMRNNSIWKWCQLQCTCLLRYPKLVHFLFDLFLDWVVLVDGREMASEPTCRLTVNSRIHRGAGQIFMWRKNSLSGWWRNLSILDQICWFQRSLISQVIDCPNISNLGVLQNFLSSCLLPVMLYCHFKMCYT